MNRKIILILLASLFIACGSNDKQARLKELENQRDNLNKEIEALRTELAMENTGENQPVKKVVELEQINSAPFHHFIKIQGTVESDNNILIPAQSSGLVKRIYVSDGQHVSKGQLLAELDGVIYEKSIAELKTNLELATTVFERQQRLWDKKIGSEIQYLQARTNKESLEQRLATVQEQYRLTKISAPISGSVDQILIKENEATAAGFGVIRIVKLTELKITAKLSEVYQGSLRSGDKVTVEIPLLNKSFSSTVSAVAQVIDPNSRTFSVEIAVPKNQKQLKPNMLVKLHINDYTNPQSLTVPLKAIQKTADKSFLFIAEKTADTDNTWLVRKRYVQPGKLYENDLEIINGLQNGEYVVVTGHHDLADNQKVRLADSNHAASNN